MKGELINIENKEKNKITDKNSFLSASLFSRMFIVVSGPLANLVLGLFLITTIYVFNGKYVSPAIVNTIVNEGPAMNAGIKTGDKIITINEEVVNEFIDVKNIVQKNPDNILEFKILRESSYIFLKIIPDKLYDDVSKKYIGRIGITANSRELKKLSFLKAIQFGVNDSITMTLEWLKGLKALVLLNISKKDVLGPIGIAKVSGSSLDKGLFPVIFLMAILSINLGLINLLPIPALDGGYIALFIYEFIFKKPLSSNIQLYLFKFGFIFLLSLMLLVTAFDLGL